MTVCPLSEDLVPALIGSLNIMHCHERDYIGFKILDNVINLVDIEDRQLIYFSEDSYGS